VAPVRDRTIPIERPPRVGEVSANLLRIDGVAWSEQQITTAVIVSENINAIPLLFRWIVKLDTVRLQAGCVDCPQYMGVDREVCTQAFDRQRRVSAKPQESVCSLQMKYRRGQVQ
jgi:hypothetical protein